MTPLEKTTAAMNRIVAMLAISCALMAGADAADREGAAEAVAAVTATGAEPPFVERHRALHGLSSADFARFGSDLAAFLDRREAPPQIRRVDFHSLKNDIFDRMLNVGGFEEDLFAHARQTIRDEAADQIWRDYCVQFLPPLAAALPDGKSRSAALDLLESTAAGDFEGLAGTALAAAYSTFHSPKAFPRPPFDPEDIGRSALVCAADAEQALPDRVTALQVAAGLRQPGVASLALEWLDQSEEGSRPVMLRVSAIAALGVLGDPAHRHLVEPFQLASDIRLRAAARSALRNL